MCESPLCVTFREIADLTYETLSASREVNHQPLEESFTDFNLLRLKLKHPNEIYGKTFNKREEGKNGADWEWWFTDEKRKQWIGVRIQAKVLNLKSNKFEHLHYQSGNPPSYQAEKLRENSEEKGTVPLYCLYLHQPSLKPVTGCTIVPYFHVAKLRELGELNTLRDVADGGRPWHILVCKDYLDGAEPLPTRVRDGIQSMYFSHRIGHLVVKPPKYVEEILRGQDSNLPPKDLAGVIVFTESQAFN